MFAAVLLLAAAAARVAEPAGASGPGAWIGLALAVVLAGAVAAILVRRWLRRTSSRLRRALRRGRRVRPRYPVVLAHGFLGFDEIEVAGARHQYFRGIADALEREGFVVHRPAVSRAASVAARAEELAAHVREIDAPRVNLVAHSMGGLDARYAIAHLGLADRVAGLVSIGTPHLGTPLADLGAVARLRAVLVRMGVRMDALGDLGTAPMEAFNRAVPDAPGVLYGSVVGWATRKRDVNPVLLPSYLWLGERSGSNDGLVPADSQRWGEVLREIDADHFAQIGWSRRFDAAGLYAEILAELRARGL